MLHDLLALLVPPLCAACLIPLPRAGDVVCGGCRRALPWLRGPQCVALRAAAHGEARVSGRAPGVRRRLGGGRLRRRGARPRGRAEVPPRAPVGRRHGGPARRGRAAVAARGGDDRAGARAPGARAGAGVRPGQAARRRPRAPHGRDGSPRPLRRRGPVRSQLGASRAERLQRGRIDVSVRGPAPARVVLVDDVHTTGATLDACARALRRAGAGEVVALTWARALPVGSLSAPAGSALTPVNESRTISSKGSKRLNGGASYADRGQGPEHPRHG